MLKLIDKQQKAEHKMLKSSNIENSFCQMNFLKVKQRDIVEWIRKYGKELRKDQARKDEIENFLAGNERKSWRIE